MNTTSSPSEKGKTGAVAPSQKGQPGIETPAKQPVTANEVTTILPTEAHSPKEKVHAMWYESPEVWIALLTAALVWVTYRLVTYTKKLWAATVDLARDAKEASDRQFGKLEESLVIAKASSDAAKQSAESATKTVETMEANGERELRAYVFVSDEPPMGCDSNGDPQAKILVTNHGRTPATELQCCAHMALQRFPLDVTLEPPSFDGGSKSSLAPGAPPFRLFPNRGSPLNDAEKAAIIAGQAAIFLWGEVVYVDVFRRERKTKFCLYCTGDDLARGHFAHYKDGNSYT